MRCPHVPDEVEDQHPDDRGDRESPHPEGDVHAASYPPETGKRRVTGGLSRRRLDACDRQHQEGAETS